MNGQIVGLLEQMRVKLAEGEEAFGPDSIFWTGDVGTADADGDEPGADNDADSDVFESFNLYFDDIIRDLQDEYDVSEADAEDFAFSVLREMVDAGEIPDLPEDEDDIAALSAWIGSAKSAGLEVRVLEAAEAEAEDPEEAEDA